MKEDIPSAGPTRTFSLSPSPDILLTSRRSMLLLLAGAAVVPPWARSDGQFAAKGQSIPAPMKHHSGLPVADGRQGTLHGISVFDYIPQEEHFSIIHGQSAFDCTDHIRRAVEAVRVARGILFFPFGTYFLSRMVFEGNDYTVTTAPGTRFRQKPGILDMIGSPAAVIQVRNAANLRLGNFEVVGNISTDDGESHHAVLISSSRNIYVGHIFAYDIRGDALYCYGRNTSDAERLKDIFVASVSGSNVFRNLLTVVGGQVIVDEVRNAGPVGYRDFDVEPNEGHGSYESVSLTIRRAIVGSAEITSDDPQVINAMVIIENLDADLLRVRSTTPPYPKEPGANAYALGIARVREVHIGRFIARNYNVYPLSLAMDWSIVKIGLFDVADCSRKDSTFATMILQQGDAGDGILEIQNVICRAIPEKYLARVHKSGLLNISVSNIQQMQCLIGTQLTGIIEGGTIDINNAEGAVAVGCRNLVLKDIITVNSERATGFRECAGITLIRTRVSFKILEVRSRGLLAENSFVNGVRRDGPI